MFWMWRSRKCDNFVMKTKKLPFVDAVHLLADRANIEVTYENGGNTTKGC